MYRRKRLLSKKITPSNNAMSIPRDGVIDAVILDCKLVVSNGGASAWNGTYEDILKALELINLASNGTQSHWNVSGLDVAIINFYDYAGKTVDPDGSVSVGAGASQTFNIQLKLYGPVFALFKDSLELRVTFNTSIASNVTLDTNNTEIEVTLDETVYEFEDEIFAQYGENLRHAYEPKVRAITASLTANTELEDAIELPVGNVLLNRGFIVASTGGSRSNSVIDKFAVTKVAGSAETMYVMKFSSSQELDKHQYALDSAITGVTVLDYANEMGAPLRGWLFSKGDIVLQSKNASSGNLRYISEEFVVIDTDIW